MKGMKVIVLIVLWEAHVPVSAIDVVVVQWKVMNCVLTVPPT